MAFKLRHQPIIFKKSISRNAEYKTGCMQKKNPAEADSKKEIQHTAGKKREKLVFTVFIGVKFFEHLTVFVFVEK